MNNQLKTVSKFMSLVLRHKPEEIGIVLNENGWVKIQTLVSNSKGLLTHELVKEVTNQSDKRRFAISDDGLSIRANQGHSINISLGLETSKPPEVLYHGTAKRFLDNIQVEGLTAQSRQHVHLSLDIKTAIAVGKRHGDPVILEVMALQMYQNDISFYLSKNGVWLTNHVPLSYINFKK